MRAAMMAMTCALLWVPNSADAQRLPPADQLRVMIEAGKDQWVAFREFNGQQLVYFTHFVSFKCGISELRYSVNSAELDEVWPLPECNEQIPFHVDPETDQVYLTFPPRSVERVAVRVYYADGGLSPIRIYGPCDVPEEVTCGIMLEERVPTDDGIQDDKKTTQ